MAGIESGEAWYLGHATPDELVSIAAVTEIDTAWADHGGNTLNYKVANTEAEAAYREFAYNTPENVHDQSIARAIRSVKLDGMNPVLERYVDKYLSQF